MLLYRMYGSTTTKLALIAWYHLLGDVFQVKCTKAKVRLFPHDSFPARCDSRASESIYRQVSITYCCHESWTMAGLHEHTPLVEHRY